MTTIQLTEDTLQQLRIKKIHGQYRSYNELIRGLLNEE